jgi:transposase
VKVLYERVAGIDVHKDMIKVAIRSPGDKPGTRKTEVLEFRTFTGCSGRRPASCAAAG